MNEELIRVWRSGKYRLSLYDIFKQDSMGKNRLAYRLTYAGQVIFQGFDFCCSPMHGIGSNETVASVLGFLSLQPGDTDDEYFKDYTQVQLNWCFAYGEELSSLAMLLDERADKKRNSHLTNR